MDPDITIDADAVNDPIDPRLICAKLHRDLQYGRLCPTKKNGTSFLQSELKKLNDILHVRMSERTKGARPLCGRH